MSLKFVAVFLKFTLKSAMHVSPIHIKAMVDTPASFPHTSDIPGVISCLSNTRELIMSGLSTPNSNTEANSGIPVNSPAKFEPIGRSKIELTTVFRKWDWTRSAPVQLCPANVYHKNVKQQRQNWNTFNGLNFLPSVFLHRARFSNAPYPTSFPNSPYWINNFILRIQ